MMSVWWSSRCVIHCDSSITAVLYCNQIDKTKLRIKLKPARLVNRSFPILLQDNAKPRVAQMAVANLQEFELELLHHPPYSLDLAPATTTTTIAFAIRTTS